jgi:signal recognition particle subunit SEC65
MKAITLYPAYIDAAKSWREGRRVPKAVGALRSLPQSLLVAGLA